MKCIRTLHYIYSFSLPILWFSVPASLLTSRAVCLRKGRQWTRGSGPMCRGVAIEYVGSFSPAFTRSRVHDRRATDVTPGPRYLTIHCHCALKRLLPLGPYTMWKKGYTGAGGDGNDADEALLWFIHRLIDLCGLCRIVLFSAFVYIAYG